MLKCGMKLIQRNVLYLNMDCKAEVTIVSGFLGAGKTTFIPHLLDGAYAGEKAVVLENEFGTVDLDGYALRRRGICVTSISAGCICCNSAGSLSPALERIVDEYVPRRIIIEPTGIAYLSDILDMMKLDRISRLCTCRNVVTIVDAKNYYKRMLISKEFFENQIRASRVIFLSKTECLGKEKIYEVADGICEIHPSVRIVTQSWDTLDTEILRQLLSEAGGRENSGVLPAVHSTNNDLGTFCWSHDEPLQENAAEFLFSSLEQGLFGEVLRVKGYIRTKCGPAEAFDYVPGEYKLGESRYVLHSELCVIGRNLRRDAFDKLF